MLKIYLIAVGAMSLMAFFLYGLDKGRAKKGAARIPELTLLTFAALGGGLGALLGMLLFRHKISFVRKAHFVLGVPLCLACQLMLLGALIFGGV